jgi:hypothetical protein
MKQSVYITNIHEKKFGFAVLAGTGEQAFIPPSVVTACDAEVGREYMATIVPNHNLNQVNRTPYQCVILEPVGINVEPDPAVIDDDEDDDTPYVNAAAITERVLDVLRDAGSPMTTDMIAQEIGSNSRKLSQHLKSMNDAGKIVKEEIWARGTQKRPSHVYWGFNMATFLS